MSRGKLSLIIGIMVVVATLLIFLVLNPLWLPSVIIGFCFILFSEIFFFGSIIAIERLAKSSNGIFVRAGLGTTATVYSLVVLVSSIIYMATHVVGYKGFVILQILLFVITASIMLILASFASKHK